LIVWHAIPFPLFLRNIPIINLFQRNFAVRGVVMAVLGLGLALTLATAVGYAILLVACIGYVIVYFVGFQPKFVIEEAENAEYVKVDGGDEIPLQPNNSQTNSAIPIEGDEDSW
jgi:hypothetical protein